MPLTIKLSNASKIPSDWTEEKKSNKPGWKQYFVKMTAQEEKSVQREKILLSILSLGIYALYLHCSKTGKIDLENLKARKFVYYVKDAFRSPSKSQRLPKDSHHTTTKIGANKIPKASVPKIPTIVTRRNAHITKSKKHKTDSTPKISNPLPNSTDQTLKPTVLRSSKKPSMRPDDQPSSKLSKKTGQLPDPSQQTHLTPSIHTPPLSSTKQNPSISEKAFKKVVKNTPPFKSYGITSSIEQLKELVLTGCSLRPANFFFAKLFHGSDIMTTMPGKGDLFAFTKPHDEIRAVLDKKDPQEVFNVSAKGFAGSAISPAGLFKIDDFSLIFGDKTYEISHAEILQTLESQTIYTAPCLPVEFYKGLKQAMLKDGIVILPGRDNDPVLLKDLRKAHTKAFLSEVSKNFAAYGFKTAADFQFLMDLTLYQIGSLVVKIEDYRCFIDGDGKIVERKAGANDAFKLINACGIRGLTSAKTPNTHNRKVMLEGFSTALQAAGSGFVLFPAVGMGIWRGDPDLYWTAFLDAILKSNCEFDKIVVNPGHQATAGGKYNGRTGDEFQEILEAYKKRYQNDKKALQKLNRIVNVFNEKLDLVQLAVNLKKGFPEKSVALFNASDPDVTLGYHVGEYTNNMPHGKTTEENYTAMGTNGLCFEGITGVHKNPKRIIQIVSA